MPLLVYSCVSYVPAFSPVRTPDEWAALHFVNAIKGTPLAGYALLPLPCGDTVRIDRGRSESAASWFAQLAVSAVPWRDLLPIGLVPIPDAECVTAKRPPHMNRLAVALASELGPDAAASDLLRWVRPMDRAHAADGTRDPQVLYGRLRLRDRTWSIAGQRLVLVDDVMASGAHLRAAAAFLRDCGATIVCAACAARACHTLPPTGSFPSPSVQVLSDFYADPDWLLPEVYDGVEL
jgi:hypothetical protein